MHDEVTAAWDRVVEDWDDPARHDALIGLVAQHNCFVWAAARYKERAGDPIADKQLERLRRAATATMLATATARPEASQPYRKTFLYFAFVVFILLATVLAAKLIIDNYGRPVPPKPTRH